MLALEVLLPPEELVPPLGLSRKSFFGRHDYVVRELYCPEADCDCRRVLLQLQDAANGRVVATINHGFDPPEPSDADLGQTFLDPLHERTRLGKTLLEGVRTLVRDPEVTARFERHYALVKQAVAHPDARLQALLREHPDPLRSMFPGPAFPRRDPPPLDPADVASLHTAGKTLPRRVRAAIAARGPAVIPELLAVLADPEHWQDDAPGQGFAGVHALTVLADLGATQAIAPAIARLGDPTLDPARCDRAAQELARFGASELEPLLELHDRLLADDDVGAAAPDGRWLRVCMALARLRMRDERIWSRLLAAVARAPGELASTLSTYGDRRALARLAELLDARDVEPDDPRQNHAIEALAGAIEALRGKLTPAQAAKRKRVRRLERRRAEASVPRTPELEIPRASTKISRNGPCWCGSGKKHKRCHGRAAAASTEVKMSEALETLAEPLIDAIDGDDAEGLRRALTLAATAWNAALIAKKQQRDGHEEIIEDMVRSVDIGDAEDVESFRELMHMLIARKHALFPDDDRLVGDVAVMETRSGLRIQAAYTMQR